MKNYFLYLVALLCLAGCSGKRGSNDTKSIEGRDVVADRVTVCKLNEMGHELKSRSSIGRVNAIQILPDGRKSGGADKRSYNSSCGY